MRVALISCTSGRRRQGNDQGIEDEAGIDAGAEDSDSSPGR